MKKRAGARLVSPKKRVPDPFLGETGAQVLYPPFPNYRTSVNFQLL